MAATLTVDYSHKTCAVVSTDASASIRGTLMEVSAGKLVITLNGSEPFDAVLTGTQITISAHQEVVAGWGFSATYDIGECTLTLAS